MNNIFSNIYVICYCVLQKLQEENERLKAHITTLETTIHKSASDFNERETKWKGEIHQLTCDLQRASQETRELTVQLMALQAKSPEVTCLCSLCPPLGPWEVRSWGHHCIHTVLFPDFSVSQRLHFTLNNNNSLISLWAIIEIEMGA